MKLSHFKANKSLDKLTYASGVLLPLFTLPQAYNVLILGETAGVSIITWGFYLISSALFVIFGFIHKEKLLVITYAPFVVIELLIIIGYFMNS